MIPIIDTYRELSPSQAFHIFLEYLLKPFVTSLKETQMVWQDFRTDELWVYEVELVYTLNNAQFR